MRSKNEVPILEDLTIGAVLCQALERFPERPALEYGGESCDYRSLDRAVGLCARCCWPPVSVRGIGLSCNARRSQHHHLHVRHDADRRGVCHAEYQPEMSKTAGSARRCGDHSPADSDSNISVKWAVMGSPF